MWEIWAVVYCMVVALPGGGEEGKGVLGAQRVQHRSLGVHRDPRCAAASPPHPFFLGAARALGELLLGNEGAGPLLSDTLLENTE